jgi:streptomycin 6-kinase
MFVIPDDYSHNVRTCYGDEWFDQLSAALARCEQDWKLTFAPPFAYQSYAYHYIAPATRDDGTPVVVKVHAPTDEFVQEVEALRLYAGCGMVRLLDARMEDKALLLEHLKPGTSLKQVTDDREATSHAASVMRQLWRPVPLDHPFPSVLDWGQGFVRLRRRYHGGHGPFPASLLAEAESIFKALGDSMTDLVLLHGDLHHENILAAERAPWLAIDPKGVVGEPAYEPGALLRNHLPDLADTTHAVRVLSRRIDQLAEELDLDRGRVRAWAVAQAVLSLWWMIEDDVNDEISPDNLRCAEVLAMIRC